MTKIIVLQKIKSPYILSLFDNVLVQGFLASFTISSKMLYDSVKEVISSENLEIKKLKDKNMINETKHLINVLI